MQKIGDSTTTANASSEFTEGNPGAGVDATLLKAQWLNAVQRELVAVIVAAGIDLDPAKDDQVLSAIQVLLQQSSSAYAADTGAANVYAIACTPVIKVLTDGMMLRFRAKAANTGASTFSLNGLAAKPIVGLGQAALQGGEIVANGTCVVIWSAVLDKWVLVSSSGGALQAANGSRSQHVVTMGQLYGGVVSLSANTALTSAHRGLLLLDAGAGDRTFSLPPSDAALGILEVVLRRVDLAANSLVIVTSGTDKIMLDTSTVATGLPSTELLFAGDYLHLRSDGAGKWWCVGQAQLPPSITSVIAKYQAAGVFTYTVPAVFRSGRRRARVTVTGGGGGGGHTESATGSGGGGGGGGRGSSAIDLVGVTSVTVTVGVGGTGGAAGASNSGSNGGTSSFGAYISSSGGAGGSAGTSAGSSGTTTGDVIYPVSAASAGLPTALGTGGGYGGEGRAQSWLKGPDGRAPGGGASGGSGTSGTRGGGLGAVGEVLIEVA
ncbi:hypothetical protein [Pseudomonas sp. NFACC45]|uniref:glycine-rich domain-containing protein n=1 Tax=Pseudomonas sp. NFACC45 TaxID=1566201 RepID=UPI0008E4845D|nr:hypothetical protein [Pseudomonas sp. NFACC45]SFH13019.1 hypothetical protein SAMN03159297_03233 [Pseudomonas sp. NFACC45]